MSTLRRLVLLAVKFVHIWQFEAWMAVIFCLLFYAATIWDCADERIGWIAFAIYVLLVGVHQWTRFQTEKEIRDLQKNVQKNIERLKHLLEKARTTHYSLMQQRSELAKAGEQLSQSRTMLVSMSDLKNKFISTVSHELRTPLTAIQECVNLVAEAVAGPVSEKQKSFLEIAQRNVERLTTLLDNLLDLSNLETGGIRTMLSKVSLEQMVAEAVNTIRPVAQKKEIDLVVAENWVLPPVLVDRQRVIQVLHELLENAIKFTRPSSKVGVCAEWLEDSGQIEVCVWDTGCGMVLTEAEQLFGKFYRQSARKDLTVTAGSGAGMGLAICKEIITQLGGSIWVESVLGKGSRFYFTLPCYSDEALLNIHYRNAVREAMIKNVSILHFAVQIHNYNFLRQHYGGEAFDDIIKEVHAVTSSCFRLEDRVCVDYTSGRMHVLIVAGRYCDLRERIQKLDASLKEKVFFAGDEIVDLNFLYGLARFPHDGDNLPVLLGQIEKQIRSGGVNISQISFDGAA